MVSCPGSSARRRRRAGAVAVALSDRGGAPGPLAAIGVALRSVRDCRSAGAPVARGGRQS
eukprot:8734725-Alexandrium_andersonii.AAC.1